MATCLIFFTSFMCFFSYILAEEASVAEISTENFLSIQNAKHKWVVQIFDEAKSNFSLDIEGITELCKKDFNVYQSFLENQTIWAIRMYESSEWPHKSLFAGATTTLGNFQECLMSQGPKRIQGHYCLAEATYDYQFSNIAPAPKDWDDWPPEGGSSWEYMKMYDTIVSRQSRRKLTWAMCMPSSCLPSDLQSALENSLIPAFQKENMSIDVRVDPLKCKIKTKPFYPVSFFISLLLLIFLFGLVIVASLYDDVGEKTKNSEDSTILWEIFLCFSAIRNWSMIWRRPTNVITFIYTNKMICFTLIVIGHSALLAYPFPKLEQEDSELIYRPFNIGLGIHGVVDIFLATSGYLTFHFGLKPSKNHGLIYFISSLVFRFIRVVPVLAVVIIFFTNILPYFGDGPLYSSRFLNEVRLCENNWWTNLLLINNIFRRNEMCLPQTWYIAADFQLAIVGGLLLLILGKNYKFGLFCLLFTIIGGVLLSAYVIGVNHFSGLPMSVILDVDGLRNWRPWTESYIQIFSRLGSYLSGAIGALILDKVTQLKWSPSNMTVFIIVLSSLSLYTIQFYGFILLKPNQPYNVVENVLFGSLQRMSYSIPIVVLFVLLQVKNEGIIYEILNWRLFLPLGRLAYGVYLLSAAIQLFHSGTDRQVLTGSSNMDIFWRCTAELFISFLAASILYLIAEGPVTSLSHLLKDSILKKLNKPATHSKVVTGPETPMIEHFGNYISRKEFDP